MIDSAPRQLPKSRSKRLKIASSPISSAAALASGSEERHVALASHTAVASYPFDGVPKLIVIERVCDILGLKRSAVHAKVATGELPAPIKFGTSRRAAARWLEHEIVAFVLGKAAARGVISPVDSPKGTANDLPIEVA